MPMLPARHYVSDHEKFIAELMTKKPDLPQKQQEGRAIWWDKSPDDLALRKRMDGGYTVATLRVRTIDLVPDSFRLLPQYLPSIRLHWKKLRPRIGPRFVEEWQTPRRWSLDRPTPFEAVRVLDPAADPVVLNRARASIAEAFPAFRNVAIAESWGGMIDVMPDAIPVIGSLDEATATIILVNTLRYYGLDLSRLYGKTREQNRLPDGRRPRLPEDQR